MICPACGHDDPTQTAPLQAGVFACGECRARIAYGRVVPRMVVEPHGPWVVIRVSRSDGEIEAIHMDHAWALHLAQNLIALVKVPT